MLLVVLTCDVPELKSDDVIVVRSVDHLQGKVYANRGPVVLREVLVHISGRIIIKRDLDKIKTDCVIFSALPFNETGLADAELSDDQDFEQMLLLPAAAHLIRHFPA